MPMEKRTVVFVTGSTEGGIGAAVCQEYARHGALVYAGVRKLEALGSLQKVANVEGIVIDVVDEDSVTKAVQHIIDRSGKIDILVNNAGLNPAGGFLLDVPLDAFRQTFEVNYFGLIRVTQKVGHHMAKRRSGTVVNIGSTAGYANLPISAAYASSKAAVHSISDVMRLELRPLGIHVLCVAPGKIQSGFGQTAMASMTMPQPDSPYYAARQAIEKRTNYSQVGKTTTSADLARAIRTTLQAPKWRRRAYLTYGADSTKAWILYYLPYILRDKLLASRFLPSQIGKQ